MTRLYLDTEFNGFGGELISLALVVPEELTFLDVFYEVCDWKQPTNPWVNEHVVPKLGKAPLHQRIFRECFHGWIRRFDGPEIICDWHADAEHFCRMLAGPDYGSSLDFACRITILRTPPGQHPYPALHP
jgi:hypothetical protein